MHNGFENAYGAQLVDDVDCLSLKDGKSERKKRDDYQLFAVLGLSAFCCWYRRTVAGFRNFDMAADDCRRHLG